MLSWSEQLSPLQVAGLAGLTSLGVGLFFTPLVRLVAVRLGLVSKPVEDRWGRRVVARLGGVAIVVSCISATLLWVPIAPRVGWVLIGAVLVFGLGLLDDLRRMPPYAKLIGQLLIGCVVVFGGVRIELFEWGWVAIPLSVLWFVLVMNAFNLLDNMDGLATGIGAIAAGFCAIHAALAQQWQVTIFATILCGACLSFLRFNFPPAKIYMGDSGSHFLGLSLASLALLGTWRHSTQLLSILALPALVLAVPIFDTLFVTIQRVLHRQHPFVGGTDHVSHRLAILGLSTRTTVLALYAVSMVLGLLSIVSARLNPLPTVALLLFVLTGLVLFGGFLARVKVYRLVKGPQEPTTAAHAAPVTLIDTMLMHKRRLLEILTDFCLLSSVYVLAYLLRFEGMLTGDLQVLVVKSLPVILVVKLACFAGCGLYRGVWRYLGLMDVMAIFRAVTLASIVSSLAVLYVWRFEGYSRAVFVIDWMLTFLAVGGARVAERLLDQWIRGVTSKSTQVVIMGAGDTGERVLRYLRYERTTDRRVVGFLDDDAAKQGMRIHGVPVLGSRADLGDVIARYGVREVLVAIGDPPGELLQDVKRSCESHGVGWKVVAAGITDAV